MILHVNFLARAHAGAAALVEAVLSALESAPAEPRTLARLRVHLDWVQYRQNFREPVTVRRAIDSRGTPSPLVELAIDVRQAKRDELPRTLATALERPPEHVALEAFGPLHARSIWGF